MVQALQSLCLYAAEGRVTALLNDGAERHWLRLACRLTGIHLGYPVLRETKRILSLLPCCDRSVTKSHHIIKVQFVPLRRMHRLRQIQQHVVCHDRAALSFFFTTA